MKFVILMILMKFVYICVHLEAVADAVTVLGQLPGAQHQQ
jgi:hypothetical protein